MYATWFQNKANLAGFYSICSNILSKVVSQKYDREWFVTKFEQLVRDVSAFKHIVANTFLPVWISILFVLKIHLLNHPINDISGFSIKSVSEALPYEQFNACIKTAYRHTLKRLANIMDETVFSLGRVETFHLGRRRVVKPFCSKRC